jgi:cystathionine beta-lyase
MQPPVSSTAMSEFDCVIERRNTHSSKWDLMEARYGVSAAKGGIPMWVADMDFRSPACVRAAALAWAEHGIYGYFGDDRDYLQAIRWWMRERHNWEVPEEAILTTHGLVNAIALCLETWSRPGDGILLFTPVYHMFSKIIHAAGRRSVECPLRLENGRYRMDFATAAQVLTGKERILLLCSPHNPGGRVWSIEELQEVARFAEQHDLLVVADEIHHDLVYPDSLRHTVMARAAPWILDRLVLLTSASKTFNIAGGHLGNVILPDHRLRQAFTHTLQRFGISPNAPGMHLITAAYSPAGAAWVDALLPYLQENLRFFTTELQRLPGVQVMPMEATYLAWVDFAGSGLSPSAVAERIEQRARIAVNHGDTFGTGGETYMRFNLATPRSRLRIATDRLLHAFAPGWNAAAVVD